MKIVVNANLIKGVVGVARKFLPTHPTTAVMGTFKLTEHNGKLYIVAFDGAKAISAPVEATTIEDWDDILIEAAIFSDIVNRLDGEITISIKNKKAIITNEIAKYQISTMSASDYPEIPRVKITPENSICLKGANIKEAVRRIGVFAKERDSKPQFGGICITFKDGNCDFVGCDGFHIGKIAYPTTNNTVDSQVIVPKTVLKSIADVIDDNDEVTLIVGRNNMMLRSKGYTFVARMYDEQYIDYSDVFKKAMDHAVAHLVNASELYDALNLATPIIGDAQKTPVICDFEANEIKIHSISEYGKIDTACSSKSKDTVEPIRIGLNSSFLFNVLKGVEVADEMVVYTVTPVSPVLIKENNYEAVILPMRIR